MNADLKQRIFTFKDHSSQKRRQRHRLMATLFMTVCLITLTGLGSPFVKAQGDCDQDDPLYIKVKNAIKQGGKYTAPTALRWHRTNRCSGCHIQTQSQMGLTLSIPKAEIDVQAAAFLYNTIAGSQQTDGSLWISHVSDAQTQTGLGLWSILAWPDKAFSFPTLYKAAQYFHSKRVDHKNFSYWQHGEYGWWNTNVAQTALVVLGLVDILKTGPTLNPLQLKKYRLQDSLTLGSGGQVYDVERGPDGKLYVLKVNGQINRLDLNKAQVTTVVTGLSYQSTGLAIAADGTFYVTGNHGRLIRITPEGHRQTIGPYYGTIRDVEMDSAGFLYLSDQRYHRILRLAPDGRIKDVKYGNGLYYPAGLTFDNKDNLYIANYGGYNILKLTPEGQLTPFADGLPFPPLWLDSDRGELYVSAKDFSRDGYTPYGVYRVNQEGVVQRILSGPTLQGVVKANGKMWVVSPTDNKLYEIEERPLDTGLLSNAQENEDNEMPLDTGLLPEFQVDLERAIRYFLSNYRDESADKTVHALRLMALSEAFQIIADKNLLSRMDAAIFYEEQWLREQQNDDGGWGRYANYRSDPLITAMVGWALDYTDPLKEDPMVRGSINSLLNTQAQDGSWVNQNNGLDTRLGATSFVMAYLPIALERLSCRPVVEVAPAECKFYAINDKGKNQSQFVVYNVDSRIENFTARELGAAHKGYDIESLAIHPDTRIIYATSGDDVALGRGQGYLYAVDAKTGALIPIGPTGFEEVDSLAFATNGTLWGWAKNEGIITIDLETGKGTLVLESDLEIEDLALAKTEALIFYGAVDTELWRFQSDTQILEPVCNNLPGETESLEMLSENLVLLGTHGGDTLQVFDIEACQTTSAVRIPTGPFKDIEGIGVIEEQCPLGEMVETALNLMKEEPNQPVCLSLDDMEEGQSIEGSDVLYPGLLITSFGQRIVKVEEGLSPTAYYQGEMVYDSELPEDIKAQQVKNACVEQGFVDRRHHHTYALFFENGMTITELALQLFDYGDENVDNATRHAVSLIGLDANGKKIATDTLRYTTEEGLAIRDGEEIGTGDACADEPGQLGNYPFKINGPGITEVRLKFENNQTGNEPSDKNFAIGKLCFTLEKLPTQLLRHLPESYVSEHVNEFIDELRHDRIGQFSKRYVLQNLIELERQFFREYINGFPGALIQEFFDELPQTPEGIPADYSQELVDDILEEFSPEFQERFLAAFPGIEETLDRHIRGDELGGEEGFHAKLLQGMQSPFPFPIPIEGLRNVLKKEVGTMMERIITDLIEPPDSNSSNQSIDDSLLDVLDALPSYILNKMLDNNKE